MSSIGDYIQSTRTELRYVAWPTQFQTIVYTALVIGVSIAVALYIGFFDFFFTRGLEEFIRNTTGRVPIAAPAESPTQGVDFNVAPGSFAPSQLDVNPTGKDVLKQ